MSWWDRIKERIEQERQRQEEERRKKEEQEMATSTTVLRCTFKDATSKDMSINFKYADKTKSAQVRAFMDTILANNSIYTSVPTSIVSAEYITTTSEDISL